MMLTPTTPQPLISPTACDSGRIVSGASASQIAIGALQLSSVKMLGEAHYHLQRRTLFGSTPGQVNDVLTKGHEETWQLLYATTPLTEFISFEIMYSAIFYYGDLPTLHISLKSIVSGAIDGTIDAGVELDAFLDAQDAPWAEPKRITSGWQINGAPSGAASAIPRPLYVDPAYRGQVVCVRIAASTAAVLALHLLDIYQEA
jgi:hypothetical protein